MILLDTNVLSELMKPAPDRAVVDWLGAQVAADVFYSAVSRGESELGIALLPEESASGNEDAADAMFAHLQWQMPQFWRELAASKYAHIVAKAARQGRPVTVERRADRAFPSPDPPGPRNVKDFADIPGLHVLNPWQLGAD
ncbi:MAG: hypothetical protein R2838_10590 [Caldilineaceae bacterium]